MRGVEGRAEEPACPRVGIGSPLGHALFPFARRAPAKAGAQTRREWASLRPDQIPASGAPRSSACAGAGRYPKERVALRPVHSLAEISFNPPAVSPASLPAFAGACPIAAPLRRY